IFGCVLLLFVPVAAHAQDGKASLDAVAKALGAAVVTSIVYSGTGVVHAIGQSQTPGMAWPRFGLKSYTRSINYDTAAMHDLVVTTQLENPPRGGGVQPIRGERRQE